MEESEEDLKSLLMKVEKADLKFNVQKTKIMASSPTSWQIDGEKMETLKDFIFLGFKITVESDCSHEIKRCLLLGRKSMTNLNNVLKSRDITLPTKVCIVQAMIFFSSHVWMWELDRKNGWVLKNWCFWTVMLEKTLESPLDSKELKPVDPKGNQLWIFIGRTDTEAETPILWPPDEKSQLIGKDSDAGKDWRQEEKGTTEDEWLDGVADSMDMSLSEVQETVKDREAWCAAVHGLTKRQTEQQLGGSWEQHKPLLLLEARDGRSQGVGTLFQLRSGSLLPCLWELLTAAGTSLRVATLLQFCSLGLVTGSFWSVLKSPVASRFIRMLVFTLSVHPDTPGNGPIWRSVTSPQPQSPFHHISWRPQVPELDLDIFRGCYSVHHMHFEGRDDT